MSLSRRELIASGFPATALPALVQEPSPDYLAAALAQIKSNREELNKAELFQSTEPAFVFKV